MGNIRSSQIKSIAKAIVVNFFDQVTADFDRNKSLVMAVTNVKSKTYRNKVAGYVTTLYRQIQENKIQTLEELE